MEVMELWEIIPDSWRHWVLVALAWIGAARLVFKVVFTMLGDLVKKTPSPWDDAVLDRILRSNTYAAIAFLFDYFLSIKLPTVDEKAEPPKN